MCSSNCIWFEYDLCVLFNIHITSVLDDKMLEDHVLFNCFYFAGFLHIEIVISLNCSGAKTESRFPLRSRSIKYI